MTSKQKVRPEKKNKARLCFLVPCCIVLITILTYGIGTYWVQIVQKYQERSKLDQQLELMKEKEAELAVDVEKLQDPDYVARYAREKYLYSKDGEIILRLPEEEKESK